jgi:hypothetical protein
MRARRQEDTQEEAQAQPELERDPEPGPRALISEEEYVRRELALTRRALELRFAKDPDGKAMERSERYLRWRYRGFVAGEVASL